jgi:hypothetical protein
MKERKLVQAVLAALWALFLVFYIAAKIQFFTRYDPLGVGSYLQKHSIYWAGMAATALLAWLVSRRFPQQ